MLPRLSKKALIPVAGILILLYITAAGLLWFCSPRLDQFFRPRVNIPFSATEWLASDSATGSKVLYGMANDLIRTRYLVGKSKKEVLQLLGDYYPKYDPSDERETEVLCYDIGGRRDLPARSRLFPFQ